MNSSPCWRKFVTSALTTSKSLKTKYITFKLVGLSNFSTSKKSSHRVNLAPVSVLLYNRHITFGNF